MMGGIVTARREVKWRKWRVSRGFCRRGEKGCGGKVPDEDRTTSMVPVWQRISNIYRGGFSAGFAPVADAENAAAASRKRTVLANGRRPVNRRGMKVITPAALERLPLSEVERVTFYKRDELTVDLICREVRVANQDWFFHEEATGWQLLLDHLAALPGFNVDWFSAVSQPPFAGAETIAYQRQ